MNMNNTGNMKSIGEIHKIISSKKTIIPLLQRNYKWSRECAAELAEDIWNAFISQKESYQLNMITIYRDEAHCSFQILDGQQRMITIKLLLTILKPEQKYLPYCFERDEQIAPVYSRQYFVNNILGDKNLIPSKEEIKSVDILRLRNNFYAMLLPLSFKTVYENYCRYIENKDACFKEMINSEIVASCVNKCLNIDDFEPFYFDEKDTNRIVELCERFHSKYLSLSNDEELSDDEIRISDISEKFQLIWEKKISSYVDNYGLESLTGKYYNVSELVDYILNKVEMLYHETTSEPIDEFLNINENKTRFVISDYIRANMISDNPVEGNGLTDEKIVKNKENRKEILKLFTSLSAFLYSDKDELIWNLIKTRYDDFTKHPDINRLKILFCDKYIGTSTKGYVYEEEIERLRYFDEILSTLEKEIGISNHSNHISWNTYNAVYMLLECKQRYRFFNLFTKDDIEKQTTLDDVTIRERFCFFEDAYKRAKMSDDLWDISYFLESQMYNEGECKVKKARNLPKETENEWCQVDRGNDNDELHNCLNQIIKEKKEAFYNL